jgi:hypothetical protein
MMDKWISIKDKLPPLNKYVLGVYTKAPWFNEDDQEHVNFVIVYRQQYPIEANNLVSYRWKHHCYHFFGQDIEYWMPLPDAPKETEE